MTLLARTADARLQRPAFVYRHLVSFEETNIMGNVYFVRHLSWQGRCREMFLQEHVPALLDELGRDLRLVTLRVACDYFKQLNVFDEVTIEMRLAYVRQNRIGLDFDYRVAGDLVAQGKHEVACMRRSDDGLTPVQPPASLLAALEPYGAASAAIRT